jgi:hypothetical protein
MMRSSPPWQLFRKWNEEARFTLTRLIIIRVLEELKKQVPLLS